MTTSKVSKTKILDLEALRRVFPDTARRLSEETDDVLPSDVKEKRPRKPTLNPWKVIALEPS